MGRQSFYGTMTDKLNTEVKEMGLVTRRQDTLDRLFDNFAIDPKKPTKEKTADPKKETKTDQNTTKKD